MVTDAALALGAPLLLALGLAAGAGRVARARPAAGALALGAAALVGHLVALEGWRRVPLVLDGWLTIIAALALAVATLERLALADRPAAARGLRALVAVAVGVMLLRAKASQWEPSALWGAAALVATGVAASSLLLERAAACRPSGWGLAHGLALAATTAGAVLAAGSLRLALVAGGLAAALGALLALRLVDPRAERTDALASGVAPVLAPVLGAVVARSHVFGELPRASVALLVVAPAGAWLAGALRGRLGRAAEPVGLALVLALAGLAAALAAPIEEPGPRY